MGQSYGTKGVYRSRTHIAEKEILDTVVNGEQVDLLGVSHSESITRTEFNRFLQDVRDGRRKLRLLLLDPTSNETLRREKDEGDAASSSVIRSQLETLEQRLALPPEELGSMVRLYDYAPSCMNIRSDNITGC